MVHQLCFIIVIIKNDDDGNDDDNDMIMIMKEKITSSCKVPNRILDPWKKLPFYEIADD